MGFSHACLIVQVVRDHIKLTLTGPPAEGQGGPQSYDMQEAYLAVLVTRHFGAMWAHMRQRLMFSLATRKGLSTK